MIQKKGFNINELVLILWPVNFIRVTEVCTISLPSRIALCSISLHYLLHSSAIALLPQEGVANKGNHEEEAVDERLCKMAARVKHLKEIHVERETMDDVKTRKKVSPRFQDSVVSVDQVIHQRVMLQWSHGRVRAGYTLLVVLHMYVLLVTYMVNSGTRSSHRSSTLL